MPDFALIREMPSDHLCVCVCAHTRVHVRLCDDDASRMLGSKDQCHSLCRGLLCWVVISSLQGHCKVMPTELSVLILRVSREENRQKGSTILSQNGSRL